MWEEKISWDAEVTKDNEAVFRRWREELHYLSKIEIPRWIQAGRGENQGISLHTFCDARGSAYAAAVFIKVEIQGGIKVHLLQAKSRVAPIKKMSIPRLELLAATIGARLHANVQESMGMEIKSFFWSDSMTVLCWIRQEDEWATFVWNRVQEIRKLTSVESWRYVPGIQNPADLPSIGCSPRQLFNSKWWEGPDWLYADLEKWPQGESSLVEGEINKERKKKIVTTMLNVETKRFYDYFSKYEKTVRMVAWMYRFLHNCQRKTNRGELSVEERDFAERKLIKIIQLESFGGEINKQLASLNVFSDEEGLLRVSTRIARREDLQAFLHPFVLPGKHPVVQRLLRNCHIGTQGTISILRERYWILGGRRPIRSVVTACKACKRYSAKRIETATPELALDRIRDAITFEISGVDFVGPVGLRDGSKAWICIFTCAVYRAVHLDVASSLSTNDFIKVLRRFVARRGRPRVIYSDNGANFHGADNAFGQLNWGEIERHCAVHRISWRFNPPSAPWWGGWWERLVGLLKQLLRRVLGRACLRSEELYTVLCDCESVINSRPLTYVSNEPDDLVALTPAMFLRELPEHGVPDCDSVDTNSLNRRVRFLQKVKGNLRDRFRMEYLGQLRQVSHLKKSGNFSIGDIVIIENDVSKRLDWPLGRVIELIPGKDQKVRVVRVQTAHGQLLRPVQCLYPLESIPTPGEKTASCEQPQALQR